MGIQLLKDQTQPPRALIRPDQNLLRWSALFATSKFKGQSRELLFQTTHGQVGVVIGRHKKETGEVVELGVLRVPDLVCLCALITIWEDEGKPTDAIPFSMAEFLRAAGKSSDGMKNYANAARSLKNLKSIPLTWHSTFKAKTAEGVQEIHIVEEMQLLGRLIWVLKRNLRLGKREVIGFKFKFHDMLLENMLNGYTRPFNVRVIKELKSELAILTYIHLDTMMAKRRTYVRSSASLFKQLGISEYGYPSNRWVKFKHVIDELQGKALSSGILQSIRVEKTRNGKDWKVIFQKLPFPQLEAAQDKKAEIDYYVNEALTIIGETKNEVTRKFLYKAGYRLGPDALNFAARTVKTDVIDNRQVTDKPHPGKILWKELTDMAQARGVDLK